jgi:two-component system phosphate regulon sensor histidine kinase PhoR
VSRRLAVRALGLMLAAVALALAAGALFGGPAGADALVAGGVVSLALALALTGLFVRHVVLPLRELGRNAERLARGDLSARARTRQQDEIGALGRAIDRMAEELDGRIARERRDAGRSRAILDAMVEAVLVTDGAGRIVTLNRAMTRLAGADAVGRAVVEAVRSPELHEAVRAASDGRERRIEFDLAGEADTRSYAATVSPLAEEGGVVVVLHDVTEVRRTDSVRRDFVANASHELRTPLTSIRGFAETLDGGALAEPEIAPRFVRGILQNAVRMQELVNDLVELSRAESPDAVLESHAVDLRDAARDVAARLEGRAHEKRIRVTVDGPPVQARADPDALDQVLVNLVDNAIKYTGADGKVVVTIQAMGEHARVLVSDDGPGIAAQHLPRIFERFYRVDAGRGRRQGGTGLGLAIVKHLVQRMEGKVHAESRVGRGTTFVVELPRATA